MSGARAGQALAESRHAGRAKPFLVEERKRPRRFINAGIVSTSVVSVGASG